MKRTIAILLAVATLSFATSALAATGTSNVKKNGSNNGAFALSATDESSMPSYEPGDGISFIISGATDGDYITLLSSKCDEEERDATVQYIDEYDNVTGPTQEVEYVIRDLDEGVYDLRIRVGENELYRVYYKVGSSSGILYGDVNGDGEFTPEDVVYLARYLADWQGYGDVASVNADANADGKVDAADNIIIARSKAKWSGYTTLPYTD